MRLMWFVLAGFVLGFAASTLWEWYYYRKQRIRLQDQRLAALEDELRTRSEEAADPLPGAGDVAWRSAGYQSPGVFLEAEEPAAQSPSAPAAALAGLAVDEAGFAPLHQVEIESSAVESTEPEFWAPIVAAAAATAEEASPATVPSEVDDEPAAPGVASSRFRPPIPRRSLGFPDDLAEIKGIGEVYCRRLYAAGIFTWHQVAHADVENLRTVTKAQASANVEEWPRQAQVLAEEHQRVGAEYLGPVPDDLTQIPGIGPVNAQQLYRGGICTYEQLAATLPDELETLFTAPVAGHEFDFPRWLARAAELAAAKRTSTTVPS